MRAATSHDVPLEAYRKAVTALDEFERAGQRYGRFVESAHALLGDGRWEQASEATTQAMRAGARATQAAQRVTALLRVVEEENVLSGARARDLVARAQAMRRLSAALAGASARLAAVCAARRDAARDALALAGNVVAQDTRGGAGARRAYTAISPRVSLAVNTSR